LGTNFFKSSTTSCDKTIKESIYLKKYFVKAISPGLFSWGTILWQTASILVFLFDFAILAIVPRQGPKNGSQYFKIKISGASFFIKLPAKSQLTGFIESINCRFSFLFVSPELKSGSN
jgi:hypothetical protein